MGALTTFLLLCALCAASNAGWNPGCIKKPVGFGRNTEGGEGGETVTPKNITQLKSYLESSQKLIIDLDRIFNFIGSEGQTSEKGCIFLNCGNGLQNSLIVSDTCKGRKTATVEYDYAGKNPLFVSSFKTIKSSNGKGGIRGKGIRIKNAQHVIIRDITIYDVNPQTIWAGDAIALDNTTNVWIHSVTTKNIGRQHIVTYQNTNKGVTISSCLFDGSTSYSAYCDGHHYWTWLFWGTHDEITLINNKITTTAGRTPHSGGWPGSQNYVHIVGNYFEGNSNVSLEPYQGSYILAEGNVFSKLKYTVNPYAKGGYAFVPACSSDAAKCKGPLGASCLVNKFNESPNPKRFDQGALNAFSKLDKSALQEAREAVCL